MEPVQANPYMAVIAAVISSAGSVAVTIFVAHLRAKRKAVSVLSQLVSDVKLIREQVFPNGGSSMRDSINRIEERQHVDSEIRRAGFHHSASPIWEADHEGRITWCNSSFAKLLGVSTEELKGHGWMSMVLRDDLPKVRHEIVQTGSHDHHIDYRAHRPKPHGILLVRTRWKRVATPSGKTVGFVGTVLSHEEVK